MITNSCLKRVGKLIGKLSLFSRPKTGTDLLLIIFYHIYFSLQKKMSFSPNVLHFKNATTYRKKEQNTLHVPGSCVMSSYLFINQFRNTS